MIGSHHIPLTNPILHSPLYAWTVNHKFCPSRLPLTLVITFLDPVSLLLTHITTELPYNLTTGDLELDFVKIKICRECGQMKCNILLND